MIRSFNLNIMVPRLLLFHCVVLCFVAQFVAPITAKAWTAARLSQVDVKLEVAKEGESKTITQARFEISGGKFHGFDLAPMKNAELIKEECSAIFGNGRKYTLQFKELFDGRTRVLLANKGSSGRGSVVFTLVHKTDLVSSGALSKHAGRARLDWTPIVWDHGTDKMTVSVALPGHSKDAPIVADENATENYEVSIKPDTIVFTKYRTVRWYPMQLIVDFDPLLVPSAKEIEIAKTVDTEASAVGSLVFEQPQFSPPFHIVVVPALTVLFGLLLMIWKSWKTRRAYEDLGMDGRFRLLTNTGTSVRLVLSLGAAVAGIGVQLHGFVAASVPALAISAALWLVRREKGSSKTRPGGVWRKMNEVDLANYQRLTSVYKSRRRSCLDVSRPIGAITFLISSSLLGYVASSLLENWPNVAWAIVVNGIVWILPVWFSSVRSELPVDATIESFSILKRWRKGLSKLVGTVTPGAQASFWVREDEKGTIEVRLRVEPVPADLCGLEVAGEVVRCGSIYKTRKVAILRMEPGTETAGKLASSPHAVEHHLTPDLEEEIIVLRNRRGRKEAGLTPLRNALALIG